MKPASFDYYAPSSVEEAIEILNREGEEARLLAGGQSLVPMMNFRLVRPSAIIDLNRIGGLAFIKDEDGVVRIGAMTRQRAAERAPLVAQKLPLLREALGFVAHLPIRSRGTIGGSLAHADPAAEIPMVLLALGGEVVAKSALGERTVAAGDLFAAPLQTTLGSGEILTEIRLPAMPASAGWRIEEFARRRGDFALAAVAAMVVAEGERCLLVRLGAAGLGPVPLRLRAAERILEERGIGAEALAAAARAAAGEVDPLTDLHASADYRRHLSGVLVRRALEKALAAAPPIRIGSQ